MELAVDGDGDGTDGSVGLISDGEGVGASVVGETAARRDVEDGASTRDGLEKDPQATTKRTATIVAANRGREERI